MACEGNYDDILGADPPVSRHAPMTLADRAAQFAPFAALTGYDGVIAETGRLTDMERELTPEAKEALDRRLRYIRDHLPVAVLITWFCPDPQKEGGAYVCTQGTVKKLDPVEGRLYLTDGTGIPIEAVYDIRLPEQK